MMDERPEDDAEEGNDSDGTSGDPEGDAEEGRADDWNGAWNWVTMDVSYGGANLAFVNGLRATRFRKRVTDAAMEVSAKKASTAAWETAGA